MSCSRRRRRGEDETDPSSMEPLQKRKKTGMENYNSGPNQNPLNFPPLRAHTRTGPNQNPLTFPPLRAHTRCYHYSGENESLGRRVRRVEGLKEFQSRSPSSSEILKDFEIGGIGGINTFQIAMIERAEGAKFCPDDVPYFPSHERVFGRNKTFDMEERKTFISSGCNHLWLEKLYGITRVAVYGVDSICVVTWDEDLLQLEKDLARIRDTPYAIVETIPYALIFEVEGLACPPLESRKINCKRSQKPFGVVSVIAGTNEVQKVNPDEASGDKFDELKAIKFLQERLNNTSHFTFHKTVKTAIRAFHRLWNKKFKPNKIRVFVWKGEWENEDYDCDHDKTVQELKGNDLLAVYYNRNNKQLVAGSLP